MSFERAPIVETPRLRLRPHALGDLDACVAMWADPRVMLHIGAPSTRMQTWARMRGYVGLWEFLGYGYWAVEEKQSARFIGEIGFADFNREIAASMQGVLEAGWAFCADVWGRGYASEALHAATAWIDANLVAARSVCLIEAKNLASVRVAEKCGFVRFDTAATENAELLFFERYRPASGTHGASAETQR